MHLYLSACGNGPANAVYSLSSESAIALLETGCVTCVSFGADWPKGAGCDPAEAIALAKFLKTAVTEARLPWVEWNLYYSDVALQRQLTAELREMDEICRQRGQDIRINPAQGVAIGLDPDFSFERFVVGQGNEMAYAHAVLAGVGAPMRNVPLWIYGDCGLGKTHLLHAIGWQFLAVNPDRRVTLINGAEFCDPENCVAILSATDTLLIDDIQCASAIRNDRNCQALLMQILAKGCLLAVSAESIQDLFGETIKPPGWSNPLLSTCMEVALESIGQPLANALLDDFQKETGHKLAPYLRDLVLAAGKGNPRSLLAMAKKVVAYEKYENQMVSPALFSSWLN